MPKPTKTFKTQQLKLTAEQVAKLPTLTANQGGWQTPYQYMAQTVKKVGDEYVAGVRDSDLEKLKEFALKASDGTWERTALEILKHNGIDPTA
jgi:hypothetical protein